MASRRLLQHSAAAALMLCALCGLVQADAEAMKAITKCAKDNNIKMETLMKACDTDMSEIPGFKCFTKCVQQLLGIMGEDGSLKPEGATKFVSEEDKAVAIEVATECIKEVEGNELCDKAHNANMCMMKKKPDIYKKSCLAILAKIMS